MLKVIFLIFCVGSYLYPVADPYSVEKGYSLIWFLFLYVTGSYFARNPNATEKKPYFYLLIFFILTFVSFAASLYMRLHQNETMKNAEYIRAFTDYSSPFKLLSAVYLFRAFVAMRLDSKSFTGRVIITLAPFTLGIYLIHEYTWLRSFVWKKLLNPLVYASSPVLFLWLFLCVACIFTAGLLTAFVIQKPISLLIQSERFSSWLAWVDKKLFAPDNFAAKEPQNE